MLNDIVWVSFSAINVRAPFKANIRPTTIVTVSVGLQLYSFYFAYELYGNCQEDVNVIQYLAYHNFLRENSKWYLPDIEIQINGGRIVPSTVKKPA